MDKVCDKCKKGCPAPYPPQNVIMDKACKALRAYCEQKGVVVMPMDWIRGWIEGNKRE